MDPQPPLGDALGLIETNSLPAMIEACDAAVKAASVVVVSLERIGCAMLTCCLRGDVASVRAAVDAGARAAAALNGLVGSHVIPRPHGSLASVLPIEGRVPGTNPGVDIDCGC
ncbi:MAG: BMC domain-containing protein [Candidatus Wallbacteria bacterium]|nr:BMC domain-containing protein [Candidatus Wallbacteria bacterium]